MKPTKHIGMVKKLFELFKAHGTLTLDKAVSKFYFTYGIPMSQRWIYRNIYNFIRVGELERVGRHTFRFKVNEDFT